jgi:HTH-type transcriptional regulator / antitoxin HigA
MKANEIEIRAIKNEEDYLNTMKIIETLLDSEPGSKEENTLEVLSILADEYEKKNYPVADPDPIDYIKYCMEHTSISKKDLTKYLGGKDRLTEILNRKKPLTLKMIKDLYNHLHIPAELLLAS